MNTISLTFNLQLATDTITFDAEQLGVSPQQLRDIRIQVIATLDHLSNSQLQLDYNIEVPNVTLAEQLEWPIWQSSQVNFNDYLWEQTCLELFIAGSTAVGVKNSQTTGYIEINASPNGRYALYQFKSYRNPSILPPSPLYNKNSNTLAYIKWNKNSSKPNPLNKVLSNLKIPLTMGYDTLPTLVFIPIYCYERSFVIPLNQLPLSLFINGIERLHPCVILRFGKILLYFAPNHATPPDFHKQQYWTHFKL